MTERWLTIKGYENRYEVSDLGHVRSLYNSHGPCSPRMMTLQSHGQYYLSIVLKGVGKPSKRYVHRLVLEAFIGPSPAGYVCDHVDGNGYNNCLANVRWLSQADNQSRRSEHGGRACGPANPLWKHGHKAVSSPAQQRAYLERTESRWLQSV